MNGVATASQSRAEQARELMAAFLQRTGVTGDAEPRRYLWTDAFAVCNLLALAELLDEPRYTDLARELIHQVHQVLGRHRSDDARSGWISGLAEEEGRRHPTAGGLRIGKPLPERSAGAPIDTRLEWNRDGQYFHYLTKWAHALDIAARRTGEQQFGAWGRELMQAACDRFIVASPGGGLHMVWKMSIDLGRPLVSSMGHHDPLDGYIRCMQLRAGALASGAAQDAELMASRAALFSDMIRRNALPTPDPLGIGGLMMDAAVLAQLTDGKQLQDEGLLDAVLIAAIAGLHHYLGAGELRHSAAQRLAFRELGLSIGLHAAPIMENAISVRPHAFRDPAELSRALGVLEDFATLGRQIEAFWLDPDAQLASSWIEHEDINAVMLATALLPEGALVLPTMQ